MSYETPSARRVPGSQPQPAALGDAASLVRRLLPLGGDDALAETPLSLFVPGGALAIQPAIAAAEQTVRDTTSAIVATASSILDEEMARGVLTARQSGATTNRYPLDAGNLVLRQVHELVDNLAALWPADPSAARHDGRRGPAPTTRDGVAEVRPRVAVKPGERATISMTLSNTEGQQVHLVPTATDLLGSNGGRIPASSLLFTPAECVLTPQEARPMTIALTVPVDAPPGCYSGLLVVKGVSYLRALVTIDVA